MRMLTAWVRVVAMKAVINGQIYLEGRVNRIS